MPLRSADLSALSRLLEESLDLPPDRLDGWIKSLPLEHAPLLPQLREMLADHLSTGQAAFLDRGPILTVGAIDDAVANTGDVVGAYRLVREIGRGGMGAVWLADRVDGNLKRQVALKLPRLTWGAGLAERMARERDIGALLEHPNIARLYDAGLDALGRPYLALEYVDGQPLDAWCETQALGVVERLRLFLQIARAVAYAHGRLVVHRDLKPSNVLVTADGQAHLLDFGIAKLLQPAPGDEQLTQEQGRVLTPHYASPEQLQGEPITVSCDVYSLGVLLYELLTGRRPHEPEGKGLLPLQAAILQGDTLPVSSKSPDKATAKALRGDIDAILAKALKRQPSERYATVNALAEDIERHLKGTPVQAQPDRLAYRVSKSLRRHRIGFAASTAVLVVVVIGGGFSVLHSSRASLAAERERTMRTFIADVFRVKIPGDAGSAATRPLSAQSLMEGGAELIEERFSGQPELQAELFGVVASAFSDMGAYRLAANYTG